MNLIFKHCEIYIQRCEEEGEGYMMVEQPDGSPTCRKIIGA